MDYQAGNPKAFPSWVPPILPIHAESLCEQITEAFRGLGKGTVDFNDLFLDEERELQRAFELEALFWTKEPWL